MESVVILKTLIYLVSSILAASYTNGYSTNCNCKSCLTTPEDSGAYSSSVSLKVTSVTGAFPITISTCVTSAPNDISSDSPLVNKRASLSPPSTVTLTHESPPLAVKVDRKSTRLNSSHVSISYTILC